MGSTARDLNDLSPGSATSRHTACLHISAGGGPQASWPPALAPPTSTRALHWLRTNSAGGTETVSAKGR